MRSSEPRLVARFADGRLLSHPVDGIETAVRVWGWLSPLADDCVWAIEEGI